MNRKIIVRILFIGCLFLITLLSTAQGSKEQKEFLLSLFWDIPLDVSLVESTKLLNASSIFTNVKIDVGPLEAHALSNPYFKSNSIYGVDYRMEFFMFFENNGKSSERRIILNGQKSRQISNTMIELLKSISYGMKIVKKNEFIVNYEFYNSSESTKPFFIIQEEEDNVQKDIFNIWLIFIEKRLK